MELQKLHDNPSRWIQDALKLLGDSSALRPPTLSLWELPGSHSSDDPCRTLKEIREDCILEFHDFKLKRGSTSYRMIPLSESHAVSITQEVFDWIRLISYLTQYLLTTAVVDAAHRINLEGDSVRKLYADELYVTTGTAPSGQQIDSKATWLHFPSQGRTTPRVAFFISGAGGSFTGICTTGAKNGGNDRCLILNIDDDIKNFQRSLSRNSIGYEINNRSSRSSLLVA